MDNRVVGDFDALLRKQKILGGTDVSCVHRWVDEYLKLTGWRDREAGLPVSAVKRWMINLDSHASPEALTDFLRAALGHLLLASLSAGFRFLNEYQLLKRAYELYQERNYHNSTIEENEQLIIA